MKIRNRQRLGLAVFLVLFLVSVTIIIFLFLQGQLGRIRHADTSPTDIIPASMETFERGSMNANTLDANDVNFNAENIRMMQADEVKNILLIGQDRRAGEERQRSDSMIICSINTKTKKIILTSLMRDMYVQIPGYSNNRINSAYLFGGMELLDETVETNFGIKIDGNVEVDFDGFVSALTVVGNIDIMLSGSEAQYLNGGNWTDQGTDNTGWDLHGEVVNSLTPDQALAYSRIRYIGNSDWDRTQRQRNVVMAAFNKVRNSDLNTMLRVANGILPYLTTDMRNDEIFSIVKTVFTENITTIENYRIPVDGYYSAETVDGMDVLVPDLTMNSQYLQFYIYGTSINNDLALSAMTPDEIARETAFRSENDGTEAGQNDGGNGSAAAADDYYGGYGFDDEYYGDEEYYDEYEIIDDDYDGFDDNTGEYYW